MKTLLDEQIDVALKSELTGIEVFTVREMGWLGYRNGELKASMEQSGFEAFVTADKNFPFQQNLDKITFVIVLMDTPSLADTYQMRFLPKIQQFLSNPPNPLPKIVHVAVEGTTKGNRREQLQKLLPASDLLCL